MPTPAMMPVTAGKNTAKDGRKTDTLGIPPLHLLGECSGGSEKQGHKRHRNDHHHEVLRAEREVSASDSHRRQAEVDHGCKCDAGEVPIERGEYLPERFDKADDVE